MFWQDGSVLFKLPYPLRRISRYIGRRQHDPIVPATVATAAATAAILSMPNLTKLTIEELEFKKSMSTKKAFISPEQVWDSFGRTMYQSGRLSYAITSVKWCPNGQSFAVGAFNTLILCDKTGWSHSRER